MSDIQDLIHKTSIDCIEKGRQMEQERIIKLLIEEGVLKPRTNENENDQQIIALIKGEK